ncbi:transglycosylase SLT domain-containing protein [Nonomuraea sp. NPDC049784]|uniref:transglycosylase SLT domain-containing protein n=1 Tax=Nonomuraea sp. NPDC049784 TaxID=3154361 RepID=UPI0033DA8C20
MSVADLPGGPDLEKMLQQVTGDPGAIDKLATAWRAVSGDINEFAGGLGAAVQAVDNAWKGSSADQFDAYMRKYGSAAEDLNLAMSNSASSLDAAASALRTSHTEISSICRDLRTNADNYKTKYKSEHPNATEADMKPELERLVNQAKTEAQKWVNSANEKVGKAKDDINGFLNGRGLTFHAIPEVSTQEFTPTPGKKIDWKPDPTYQQRTTLQSGGRGPGGGPTGFGGYGPSGPPPAGGGPAPTGQVKDWIEQAIAILEKNGVPASKMNASDIWMIIKHESGGNPNAINNWDSNAAKGTPSKGLMQTIDPTFNSYSLDGHKNIYNPVDNIIAGVRYAISRYGSVSNVPGVVNTKRGVGYVGY